MRRAALLGSSVRCAITLLYKAGATAASWWESMSLAFMYVKSVQRWRLVYWIINPTYEVCNGRLTAEPNNHGQDKHWGKKEYVHGGADGSERRRPKHSKEYDH